MLRKFARITVVVLALASTNGSLAQSAGPSDKVSDQMKATSDIVRAQADLTRAQAEANLNIARAHLVNAQAMGEMVRVREMILIVNRLQIEMQHALRREHDLKKKADSVEANLRTANVILMGRVTSYALRSLTYLQSIAFVPSQVSQAMSKELTDEAYNEVVSMDANFSGKNVGQLIMFLVKANKTVEPWGPAHQSIVDAYISMLDGAQERLRDIRSEIERVQQSERSSNLPTSNSPRVN